MLAGGLLKGLLFVTLAVCTFLAVGLIVAGRVGSVATASAVTSAIYFPLVFLSNLVIPFNDFPGWIRSVLDYLPSTLAATMLRDGLFRLDGGGADWHAAGLLGIWAVAASAVALKTFRWNAR